MDLPLADRTTRLSSGRCLVRCARVLSYLPTRREAYGARADLGHVVTPALTVQAEVRWLSRSKRTWAQAVAAADLETAIDDCVEMFNPLAIRLTKAAVMEDFARLCTLRWVSSHTELD
eukprot:3115380-Pyramimonas_sp.AAC.1